MHTWRLRSKGTDSLACILNDHKYCGGFGQKGCDREGCNNFVGHCIYCFAVIEHSERALPRVRAYGNRYEEPYER